MSQENVEIVRRVLMAFQEGLPVGRPDAAFDTGLLAEDAEWIVPPGPGFEPVYRGREGFREFMRVWTEDFEWTIEVDGLIDAGGVRVVAVLHQYATGRSSGVPVDMLAATVYEVGDGQVIRMTSFFDPKEALEAVGLSE